IPENELISLSDKFSLPSTMQNLMPLWNDGSMKIINTVGYDNHNLSHFTSSDIISSANQAIEQDSDKSGWLGRFILNENPDFLENLPDTPGAIKISSGSSIAFQNSEQIDMAVNFNTPDRLLQIAESGFVYDTENVPDNCYYGDQVGFLRSIWNITFNYAPQISEAYGDASNSIEYSNNELARQLAIVARLIKGGLGTQLYMVTLDGFDTHENQNQNHPQLMNSLSNAVSEFYTDLAASSQDDKVLTVSMSEFGRRIAENTGGTDHGTAAPVLLFGPALNGNGILGDDPDLQDVDNNGNLKHSVDFRSIYSTILESWLCLDPAGVDEVLGDDYLRLGELGLNCEGGIGINSASSIQQVSHAVRKDGNGGFVIDFKLARPGNVSIGIYSLMGQKISSLHEGYLTAGSHKAHYINQAYRLTNIPLIYRIECRGKSFTGKFFVD
ncbi:DUF1501 domain-containing protein, partial [Chitinophagales bacterium]|nr:DUF1501 domain-containing protein [Chitinophagales bacterium]